MTFINAREYQKNDPEYLQMRKKCYQFNLKVMIIFLSATYLTIVAFSTFPLLAHKLPTPIRWPKSFGSYPRAYYPWYFFIIWSGNSSALLGPNSCLLIGNLIEYLNNEFKILCIGYRRAFESLSDNENEDASDEDLERIETKLRECIIYHSQLVEYVLD